ncbi:MAG: T9SS type A sorting domain-containing protein [Chitinophagales bacterium]|nr:T9SS type A sorting domain-containing protein [Chitinophagales bacterium]
MQRRPLLLIFFFSMSITLMAQDIDVQNYRTYDGSSNNLTNTDWGATGTNLELATDVGYENLIDVPAGSDRPNPRVISNTLFAQDGILSDPMNLSDFCWVWGQFIDHDIGLTPDGDESLIIDVPQGDDWFDPFNTGEVKIYMHRNTFDPTTGTTTQNPRRHPNLITAFVDGSGVYGSTEAHAFWLRSFEGGKLKTSAGNLPPYNTYNGEYNAPIDPNAPNMDNATGIFEKIFVCGDVRANENPLLLSFHTIFMREHNRLCDELLIEHPDWTDEELYQHARKLVGAQIQAIVYNEWLPAMGVDLPTYNGYDDQAHPQLMNVFTAAAYRLGHTLLNGNLMRMDNDGNEMPGGPLALRDAFFNPLPVAEEGVDPFIKGMGVQTQQSFDAKVIDDVRNFLFGPPGAGGLDLASININRGRERGLADYNTIRNNFGLQNYVFFQQINPDPEVYLKLVSLYGNINNVDPWVGMLAEERMDGALFGPTVMKIMEVQFQSLRDGDRFYYENDPILTEEEKTWVSNNTLHDVIMRNTGITLMQDNVFAAMPHDDICENMTADVSGNVFTPDGQPIANATVNLLNTGGPMQLQSSPNGDFYFVDVPACDVNTIGVEKDNDLLNGVSTADLILIQQHILGVATLDSPYKIIAADANNSGSVTALDQIVLRKAILSISTFFPNNTSWRFIPQDHEFQTNDPLTEGFPEIITINNALSEDMNLSFTGIKVGDVTGDVDPSQLSGDDIEDRNIIAFQLEDVDLKAGETYKIALSNNAINHLSGYQFALDYDENALLLEGIEAGALSGLTDAHFGVFEKEGIITTSWVKEQALSISDNAELFYLHFQALEDAKLSSLLKLADSKTKAEAYDATLETSNVTLAFLPTTESESTAIGFALYQNQPNPFNTSTLIPFELEEKGWAKLSIYDIAGRTLLNREGQFDAGYHEWEIGASELATKGLLFYRLETNQGTATLRMVVE